MNLDGTRLGPYELTSKLGAGGMGEVYKARDTRLGRSVAMKLLPARLSDDPLLKKRFLREARAISSLNHPNICALYDIGSEDGRDFLVMELLEGETLAERLSRGPVSVDDALLVGMEVAGALDRAHRQGIIHRDLKPGNIMVTRSGAKLLDFGLAHLAKGDQDMSGGPLTIDGALVGTIEYMAPEQLSGGAIDARTDIFSFGTMLYEMLTGQRPFAGENRASVIGAILFAEPRTITDVRADLPVAVQRLISGCLAKAPEERIQTAHDLRREIEWIASGNAGVHSRSKRRRWVRPAAGVIAAAVLLFAGIAAGVFSGSLWRGTASREIRFNLSSPVIGTQIDWPVLSPDGTRVAFIVADSDRKSTLWIREFSSTAGRPVPGSDGAAWPFWSPDGSAIAFFASTKLLVSSIGSAAKPVAVAGAPRGGSWGSDATILYAPHISSGIFATSAIGSTPRAITQLSSSDHDVSHRWPEFLPDGKHFLFVIQSRNLARSGLYIGDVRSVSIRKIANVQSRTVPTADGHLLFVANRRLYRQPFDLERGEVAGPPVVIAEDVNVDLKATGASAISAARDGSYIWLSKADARSELVWLDRTGKRMSAIAPASYYVNPALSPDDRRVVVSQIDAETGRNSLLMIDARTGASTPFVADDSNNDGPIWSTDGTRVIYSSDRRGKYEVFERGIAGIANDRFVFGRDGFAQPLSWRAGAMLYQLTAPDGTTALWIQHGDAAPPREVLKTDEGQADLSPDARWVAYVLRSQDTARFEVFIESADDPSRRRQISSRGGAQPTWRADGRELYYIDSAHRLIAVDFRDGEIGPTIPLFSIPVENILYANRDFVPDRNGQRFLVNLPVGSSRSAMATVAVKALAAR